MHRDEDGEARACGNDNVSGFGEADVLGTSKSRNTSCCMSMVVATSEMIYLRRMKPLIET